MVTSFGSRCPAHRSVSAVGMRVIKRQATGEMEGEGGGRGEYARGRPAALCFTETLIGDIDSSAPPDLIKYGQQAAVEICHSSL